MAEVTNTTIPYEILIRFDVDGEIQGAHYVTRQVIKIDGETVKDEPSAAQPIDVATGLTPILGDALVAALSTIDSLNARIVELETPPVVEPVVEDI